MRQNVAVRNDRFPAVLVVSTTFSGNDVLTLDSQADAIFYRIIQHKNTVILTILLHFLCDLKEELVNMQE